MISAQIQVVPLRHEDPMGTIDQAIAIIKSTNLNVEVGPFGTAVEGALNEIEDLISKLLRMPELQSEALINVQFHLGEDKLTNEQKTSKHR